MEATFDEMDIVVLDENMSLMHKEGVSGAIKAGAAKAVLGLADGQPLMDALGSLHKA